MAGIGAEVIVLWGLASVGAYQVLIWLRKPLRLRQRRTFKPYLVANNDPAATAASTQLRDVMGASFSPRKIMSANEYFVFKLVEEEARQIRGLRVFAQTSLGEVIGSDNRQAHSAINSKRVDVLVISPQGYPLLAVEYQGGGHYQGTAAARDAVKKEALRRAGVGYVELLEKQTTEERRTLIRGALMRATQRPADAVRTVSR